MIVCDFCGKPGGAMRYEIVAQNNTVARQIQSLADMEICHDCIADPFWQNFKKGMQSYIDTLKRGTHAAE